MELEEEEEKVEMEEGVDPHRLREHEEHQDRCGWRWIRPRSPSCERGRTSRNPGGPSLAWSGTSWVASVSCGSPPARTKNAARRIGQVGRVEGGHAYLCVGVDIRCVLSPLHSHRHPARPLQTSFPFVSQTPLSLSISPSLLQESAARDFVAHEEHQCHPVASEVVRSPRLQVHDA